MRGIVGLIFMDWKYDYEPDKLNIIVYTTSGGERYGIIDINVNS